MNAPRTTRRTRGSALLAALAAGAACAAMAAAPVRDLWTIHVELPRADGDERAVAIEWLFERDTAIAARFALGLVGERLVVERSDRRAGVESVPPEALFALVRSLRSYRPRAAQLRAALRSGSEAQRLGALHLALTRSYVSLLDAIQSLEDHETLGVDASLVAAALGTTLTARIDPDDGSRLRIEVRQPSTRPLVCRARADGSPAVEIVDTAVPSSGLDRWFASPAPGESCRLEPGERLEFSVPAPRRETPTLAVRLQLFSARPGSAYPSITVERPLAVDDASR